MKRSKKQGKEGKIHMLCVKTHTHTNNKGTKVLFLISSHEKSLV